MISLKKAALGLTVIAAGVAAPIALNQDNASAAGSSTILVEVLDQAGAAKDRYRVTYAFSAGATTTFADIAAQGGYDINNLDVVNQFIVQNEIAAQDSTGIFDQSTYRAVN